MFIDIKCDLSDSDEFDVKVNGKYLKAEIKIFYCLRRIGNFASD